ncbi:MAG: hypothetical protein WKF54_10230 [Nocardioidaceae bacterium]
MTESNEPYDYQRSSESEQSSGVKDVAGEQAQQVAGTAKHQATQVVDTAKEQVQAVTSDIRDQTRQLAGDAREQLMDHAGSQRDRAVESLRSVGDELSEMAEKAESSGLGVQLAREGGDVTKKVADFLEQREPGQLVDEVRDLARRRPGAFLLGAALAGVVAGRAARGAKSAHSADDGSFDSASRGAPSGDIDVPSPYGVPATDPLATPALETDVWGPGGTHYPESQGVPTPPGGTL